MQEDDYPGILLAGQYLDLDSTSSYHHIQSLIYYCYIALLHYAQPHSKTQVFAVNLSPILGYGRHLADLVCAGSRNSFWSCALRLLGVLLSCIVVYFVDLGSILQYFYEIHR